MKFDVYGRFIVEIRRESDAWVAYLLEPGKRIKMPEIGIPAILSQEELVLFLDDLYHEKSRPGQKIRIL